MRITSIQTRLDEQRQRAEELQRAGTSDLTLKVYELQAELTTMKETLSSRDKQIAVLKNHLAQSKEIIDKQEIEIAAATANSPPSDRERFDKLEAEIATKETENKLLRDKMRSEMIQKVALPDLMETMLADKTDEIDFLKEQLEAKEKELKAMTDRQLFSVAENKLNVHFSRSVDDSMPFEEVDYIRRMPETRHSLTTIGSAGTFSIVRKQYKILFESFEFQIRIFRFYFRKMKTFFVQAKCRNFQLKNLRL